MADDRQVPAGVLIGIKDIHDENTASADDIKAAMEETKARELAERAWVERASRERGDLDLTEFQERAARSQFRRWWDINVDT